MRNWTAAACRLSILLVGGCGSEPRASPQSGAWTGGPSGSEPTQRPPCPNSEGRACLGKLAAGTYGTVTFEPGLKYTVPG